MTRIYWNAILLFWILLGILSLCTDVAASEWELYDEKDGIQLYRKTVKESKFDEFRGIAIVETRLEVIGMVLRDIPAYTRWMSNCKHSELIEQFDENNMIAYHVQNSPWPVLDRDVVLRANTTIDWESGMFMVELQSIEDTRVPPRNDRVRMAKMIGTWLVEYVDREHTRVTYSFAFDPAGSLPAGLVNDRAKNTPYKTLLGLKEIVKDPAYIEAADTSQDKMILEQYIHEGRLKKE